MSLGGAGVRGHLGSTSCLAGIENIPVVVLQVVLTELGCTQGQLESCRARSEGGIRAEV